MKLEEMQEQLMSWLDKLNKQKSYRMLVDEESNTITIKLFTSVNEYSIRARPIKDKDDKGYLGCISTCRMPRAGESWTRGNDLSDGIFSEDVWNKIISDIVGYELVKIHDLK
jgi:hypothetical protein